MKRETVVGRALYRLKVEGERNNGFSFLQYWHVFILPDGRFYYNSSPAKCGVSWEVGIIKTLEEIEDIIKKHHGRGLRISNDFTATITRLKITYLEPDPIYPTHEINLGDQEYRDFQFEALAMAGAYSTHFRGHARNGYRKAKRSDYPKIPTTTEQPVGEMLPL